MNLILNDYVTPSSIDDAYALMMQDKKHVIKGGGAWLKLTMKSAEKLISLDELNLNQIVVRENEIEIGSMTTLREIETNEDINNLYEGILSLACHNIMGINVRNIATIGGSVMGRLAFSDLYPALLVMDTTLVFYKSGAVKLAEFLQNPTQNKDLLLALRIPKKHGFGYYKKVATTPLDFAIMNLAISYQKGLWKIAVGSTPYMASLAISAADYLNQHKTFGDKQIQQAISYVFQDIKISSNIRANKEYRVKLIETYIKRGIKKVISNVG